MVVFVAGLIVFLGVHSTRVFAGRWRASTIARIGEGPWKGLYSLVSIAAFVALVWGYGQVRHQIPVWDPPEFMPYVTLVVMLPVFVLLAAAYVPRNSLKAGVHHPMLLAVKLWAFAHLLSNGNLADVLLFGSFLAWAVVTLSAARKRDRAAATVYPRGTTAATMVCLVVGLAVYLAFIFGLHAWLIGVDPI
jgi:uncharacterized membrane protein